MLASAENRTVVAGLMEKSRQYIRLGVVQDDLTPDITIDEAVIGARSFFSERRPLHLFFHTLDRGRPKAAECIRRIRVDRSSQAMCKMKVDDSRGEPGRRWTISRSGQAVDQSQLLKSRTT
jgi:hypothetical protein